MRRVAGVALVLGVALAPLWPARAQDPPSVEIHNNYFSPAEIHVPEGGNVTWTDLGDSHALVSDDGVSFDANPGCDPLLKMGCMANGDKFQHQFNFAETIPYHCRVHGSAMVGKVIVDASPTTSTTTSTSTTQPTSMSDTSTTLSSDQPTVTQGSAPSLPQATRAALPRAIVNSRRGDDLRPWVFADVAIALVTIITGIVLVRRGRIPFG
jgi:plastocyanin